MGSRDDEDVYRLLHEALRRSGRAGIGRFTLEMDGKGGEPGKREVDMASRLLESLHEDFEPERYEDSYRAAVLDLIERKAAGKEIDLAAQARVRAPSRRPKSRSARSP